MKFMLILKLAFVKLVKDVFISVSINFRVIKSTLTCAN